MPDFLAPRLWLRADGFAVSTDRAHLDLDVIQRFLREQSYWARWMPRELVERMVHNSALCFGVHRGDPTREAAEQVGFARVVTDFVRFAYLADVFILPDCRGLGLGKWLVGVIAGYPGLRGVRFLLATDDAHGLYAQHGFAPHPKPASLMARPLDVDAILRDHGLSGGGA